MELTKIIDPPLQQDQAGLLSHFMSVLQEIMPIQPFITTMVL
jgi:hypothetical protein